MIYSWKILPEIWFEHKIVESCKGQVCVHWHNSYNSITKYIALAPLGEDMDPKQAL